MYSTQSIELTTGTSISSLLSDGGFSRVYLCKHMDQSSNPSSFMKVIKVYPRERARNRSHRIMAEKAVMQRTIIQKSPYIGKLMETLQDSTHLYMVLEPYHCGHLHLHIRSSENERLQSTIAKNYAAEIASALLSLMKSGCVHRDIKPKNCLVDRMGHLKICDFGSSKILNSHEDYGRVLAGGHSTFPRTHTVIGTMQYMAPEIVAKTCGYSFEVDWWSFGVLLFEMLTGAPPTFNGVPVCDNNTIIKAAADGLWPDEEASAVARSAATCKLPPIPDASTEHIEVDLGPWTPILSDANASIFSSSKLHSFGWHCIQNLLVPNPEDRLGPWTPEKLKNHPFFERINWDDVEAGVSPTPDIDFNRSLGFLEAEDEEVATETDADRNLFEGF